MCGHCMQHSGLFDAGAMQHVPVVRNTENVHVFQPENVSRLQDVTTIFSKDDEKYEFSQPKTFLLVDNTQPLLRVDNPFDTPAQCGLCYVQIAATAGRVQLQIDNADQSPIQNTNNVTGMPGLLFVGSMNAVFTPPIWTDFQEFVALKTLSVPPNITVILLFRRETALALPRNLTPMNELTQ